MACRKPPKATGKTKKTAAAKKAPAKAKGGKKANPPRNTCGQFARKPAQAPPPPVPRVSPY